MNLIQAPDFVPPSIHDYEWLGHGPANQYPKALSKWMNGFDLRSRSPDEIKDRVIGREMEWFMALA